MTILINNTIYVLTIIYGNTYNIRNASNMIILQQYTWLNTGAPLESIYESNHVHHIT